MISQFKLSELGGSDLASNAKLFNIRSTSNNMLLYVSLLLSVGVIYLIRQQMVCRQGHTDDCKFELFKPLLLVNMYYSVPQDLLYCTCNGQWVM